MTALNERLREIGVRAEKARHAPYLNALCNIESSEPLDPESFDEGAEELRILKESVVDTPALLRAIRVLVEQRDSVTRLSPEMYDDDFTAKLNTAVLAAMDAPGKEEA